jgi:hypothetical protein
LEGKMVKRFFAKILFWIQDAMVLVVCSRP